MRSIEFVYQMQLAIQNENYLKMLTLIKDPDVDINQTGRGRINCLHCAVQSNNPVFVELFLLMNANPYAPSEITGTPFEYAEKI